MATRGVADPGEICAEHFRADYLVCVLIDESFHGRRKIIICRDFYVIAVFVELDDEKLIRLFAARERFKNRLVVIDDAGIIEGIVKDLGLSFDDPRKDIAPKLCKGILDGLAIRGSLIEFPAFDHAIEPFSDHHVFAFPFVIESGILGIVS